MDLEKLRVAVYSSFAKTGVAPHQNQLSVELNVSEHDVREGLLLLAEKRHLVLDQQGDIVMAHPFSSVPLGFSVMGSSTLWWGGCAWDSFAMAHLLTSESSLLISTTCPNCSKAMAWNVNSQAAPEGEQVAHFLVPAQQMWDDVVHTCGNQRIFCNENCVHEWLQKTRNVRGYVMNLETLWLLSSDWYTGRLEIGYQRREPSQANEYLRSVGLAGSFWGLE